MKLGKKQLIVDENGQSVTVKGSDVTVTVGSYSTNVDTSGAATADSWSDYAVDKA